MKTIGKLLRGIIPFVLFAYAFTAQAVEKVIGYCPDSLTENVYPVGVSGQQVYVSAAVKFTANTMQSLKGNQITKIRIAIGSGMQNVYAWVRVGSYDATPTTMQKVSSPTEGWNEVTLATPYDIDGSEIYVGYSGRQPSGKLCVWLDGEDNANATYIKDGTSWDDYYGYGWGSLCIQAVVSGDNFVESDLAVESIALDSTYYKNTSSARATITVVNQGKQDFAECGYKVEVDDGSAISHTGTIYGGVAASEKETLTADLDLSKLTEGVHTLRFMLIQNGESTDMVTENDTLTKELLVYSTQYDKNVLLEQYTTIACVNCPYGDAVLNKAVSGRSNIAWVAHHVGYYTDELTIDESSSYMTFGVTGAPMATVDRTFLQVESSQTKPAFSIGFNDASQGAQLVDALFDYQCSFPAFAQVTPTLDYDESTRLLTVSVSGQCNDIFRTLTPETCLSIFLTENNVTAKRVQTGTTDDYTHNHVLRSVLTDTFGDAIEWDGNTFTATKTVTLDEAWKPEDVRVVAFISKPYSSNNVNNAQVINAATARITNLSAISTLKSDEADSVEVFTADVKRVDSKSLGHGLYIIKVRAKGKTETKKLIY